MNATPKSTAWSPLDPGSWEGDPEDLVGWETEIAEQGDTAGRMFASMQEAFYTGLYLGFKQGWDERENARPTASR
jgi:hypothetical protein